MQSSPSRPWVSVRRPSLRRRETLQRMRWMDDLSRQLSDPPVSRRTKQRTNTAAREVGLHTHLAFIDATNTCPSPVVARRRRVVVVASHSHH